MFCRKCGYDLPEDSSFCAKCGEQILPSSPPPQQIQQAQKSAPPPKQNKTHSAPEDAPKTFKERVLFLFKFSGRMPREALIKNLLLAIPLFIILYIIGFFFAVLINNIINGIMGKSAFEPRPFVLDLFVCLFCLTPMLSIWTRRIRDAGIPVYNLFLCIGAWSFLTIAEVFYSINKDTEFLSHVCGIASYIVLCILLFLGLLPSKKE